MIDGQHREGAHYNRRMVGYLLEHPAVEESAHELAQRHGQNNLQMHIITAADTAILKILPNAAAGDVLWHTNDEQHAGIIKQDGAICE